MGNILKYASCIAVAALCACSKNDCANPTDTATEDYKTVNIKAVSDATRVHFGDKEGENYPVLWDADDQIHVTINAQDTGSGNKFISSHETTVSDDGRTASFAVKLLNTTEPEKYVYYAYTPIDKAYLATGSTHDGGFYANPDTDRVRLWIPAVQTPTATAADRNAHIMYGVSQDCGSYDADPTLHFSHWTAYGKLTLRNLALDEGDAVKTITLTAADGTYLTGGFVHRTLTGATEDSSSTHSSELQIVTSATENILFGCYAGIEGVNDLSGTKLTVKVATENLVTFTRELDLTDKTLKFEAGKMSTFAIDMASAEKVSPIVGKKLVAYVDFGTTLTNDGIWNNYTAPKSGTKITLNDADGQITNVSLEITANFTDIFTASDSAGKQGFTAGGIEWPRSVWYDALRITNTANDADTKISAVTLSGLDPTKSYKLVLLAARYNSSANARATNFTIIGAQDYGSTEVDSNLTYNWSDTFDFATKLTCTYTGTAPATDGTLTIQVIGKLKKVAEGHLNAMYIAEE